MSKTTTTTIKKLVIAKEIRADVQNIKTHNAKLQQIFLQTHILGLMCSLFTKKCSMMMRVRSTRIHEEKI
jgi:hypothetical protein